MTSFKSLICHETAVETRKSCLNGQFRETQQEFTSNTGKVGFITIPKYADP